MRECGEFLQLYSSYTTKSLLSQENMPHIDNDIKLDFKDVLFRPKRSTLKSRGDVSVVEYLTTALKLVAAVVLCKKGHVSCMLDTELGTDTIGKSPNSWGLPYSLCLIPITTHNGINHTFLFSTIM